MSVAGLVEIQTGGAISDTIRPSEDILFRDCDVPAISMIDGRWPQQDSKGLNCTQQGLTVLSKA